MECASDDLLFEGGDLDEADAGSDLVFLFQGNGIDDLRFNRFDIGLPGSLTAHWLRRLKTTEKLDILVFLGILTVII